MLRTITLIAATIALGLIGCSAAPKPPDLDEDDKRPANTSMAIELQRCQHDLHNTRIQATESQWLSESLATSRQHIQAMQKNLLQLQHAMAGRQSSQQPNGSAEASHSNSLFMLYFDYGSAKVTLSEEAAALIKQAALSAPLIAVRGRTDGHAESSSEAAIAKARAFAVRDLLITAGVEPGRIRASYQAVGDHLADNSNPQGRRLNRRVEIEIYRSSPKLFNATTAPRAPSRETAALQ
ncbi:hypothetical protein DBR47_24395 [Paucibacter sp. KBW04]|nr:hypothetical protein DBR47_24395 [Paucibacter sp. KBW04]